MAAMHNRWCLCREPERPPLVGPELPAPLDPATLTPLQDAPPEAPEVGFMRHTLGVFPPDPFFPRPQAQRPMTPAVAPGAQTSGVDGVIPAPQALTLVIPAVAGMSPLGPFIAINPDAFAFLSPARFNFPLNLRTLAYLRPDLITSLPPLPPATDYHTFLTALMDLTWKGSAPHPFLPPHPALCARPYY